MNAYARQLQCEHTKPLIDARNAAPFLALLRCAGLLVAERTELHYASLR